jgi:hypothetical protein
MRLVLRLQRRSVAAVLLPALVACTDGNRGSILGPSAQLSVAGAQGLDLALAAQQRHTEALMRINGVVGTSVGITAGGQAVVQVYLVDASVPGLPDVLDGVPVRRQVTGILMAYSDPTLKLRPAPIGYSVGHFAITAGTIGARVLDAASNMYLLSNNHVLANGNDAAIGDAILQPGPVDGGGAADQIGTLAQFKAINFAGGDNTIDAALATANATVLSNTTPADAYGMPSGQIWGDGNNDGTFDNKNALLNLPLQKFGRTTQLTKGAVTGINAILNICYEALFVFCIKSARFVDQIVIEPGSFSGGGDSGSLIVTDDANRNPVALLFAGSTAQTIANRIDLVLNHFGVHIDAGSEPPPPPVDMLDVAIQGVSGPGSVTVGNSTNIVVTIRNAGNQDVATAFDVTLRDATYNVDIGTQSVASLAAGATTTRTFAWNTTGGSIGAHTLTGQHNFTDDNAANNQASTVVSVSPQSTSMHIGNLTSFPSNDGTSWSATVEIEVHDAAHNVLNDATVVGSWTPPGLNSNTCTTGDLGGNGTCIVLYPGINNKKKSVSFSVNSLTKSLYTYASGSNHDPDGGSNGTTIKVNKP